MIEKKITVPVDLTPQELAFEFCNMSDEDQAEFFNSLAKIVENWQAPFSFQLQYLADCTTLTQDGKSVMKLIGEYGE